MPLKEKQPIIEVKNVSLFYDVGLPSELQALKNISLKIYPGEYIIFFGPSGCGKSSLLYSISGLEFPQQGQIFVQGKNINQLSKQETYDFHRRTIGMVFQAFYLIQSLTIKDNVALPMIFTGIKPAIRDKRAEELLNRFGVLPQANKLPSQLSGGQQQRVAIARALANDPEIILADEPVGNLDSKSAQVVMELLEELNRKDKKTVILVTHDPRYLDFADRIFYMKDGALIKEVKNLRRRTAAAVEQNGLGAKVSQNDFAKALAHSYLTFYATQSPLKQVLNRFYAKLSVDQILIIEDLISKRIQGEITAKKLVELLGTSLSEGGAGLSAARAVDFAHWVESLISINDLLKKQLPVAPKAERLLYFLWQNVGGKLNSNQSDRLKQYIALRLSGKVDYNEFHKLMDLPIKDGGVGLNHKMAKKVSDMMQMILLQVPEAVE